MCHDFMGNEIMNNVSQQVMKGEKVTQSKELISSSSYIVNERWSRPNEASLKAVRLVGFP
jgi:hypothetical protein